MVIVYFITRKYARTTRSINNGRDSDGESYPQAKALVRNRKSSIDKRGI